MKVKLVTLEDNGGYSSVPNLTLINQEGGTAAPKYLKFGEKLAFSTVGTN